MIIPQQHAYTVWLKNAVRQITKHPQAPKKGYLNGYGRTQSDGGYVSIPMSLENRSSVSKTRAIRP
jgi:hypothetical protein